MAHEKGIYGFRYNNEDFLLMNQVESQIQGLGEHIFNFLKELLIFDNGETKKNDEYINQIKSNLDSVVKVKPHTEMTDSDREYIRAYHKEFGLSDDKNILLSDWASFFSQEEGNLSLYYFGFKYLLDSSNYILLSKDIHYAYIINLDDDVFEVYYGDNKEKGTAEQGRYASKQHSFLSEGYWGVTLEKTIPFESIKSKDAKLESYF